MYTFFYRHKKYSGSSLLFFCFKTIEIQLACYSDRWLNRSRKERDQKVWSWPSSFCVLKVKLLPISGLLQWVQIFVYHIMQWNPNFSKNKLEFDFDHENMIMITFFDHVFFLICEATLYVSDRQLPTWGFRKLNCK